MWIARDKDGTICIFKKKPIKYTEEGQWGDKDDNVIYAEVDDVENIFYEVKWEDNEPRELILR